MNILLATEVIQPGGAETFVLRLSQELHQRGHKVWLFVFYRNHFNKDIYQNLAKDVQLVFPKIPNATLLRKIDSLLFRLCIDYSFTNRHIKKGLELMLENRKIDVVHSHLLKVDKLCLEAATKHRVPVVTTIHGDYLQFYNKLEQKQPIPLLNYEYKAKSNLKQLSKVVCISDKQISFMDKNFSAFTQGKVEKIYNGYTGHIQLQRDAVRKSLDIPTEAFVFGMVSRGIASKGWETAIKAFEQLNNPNTHLVLVGGGDYLHHLKSEYAGNTRIHFTGHNDNPINMINIFDVGLLPTTYPSESLPTVVIEYLYCGKPVIASDAGEISYMISREGKDAGVIVPIVHETVSENKVSEAMQRYTNDPQFYNLHKENTAYCFEQFEMNKCVDRYMQIYAEAAKQ